MLRDLPRQALHAKTVGFVHPGSGRPVLFDSDLPEDMARMLSLLRAGRL